MSCNTIHTHTHHLTALQHYTQQHEHTFTKRAHTLNATNLRPILGDVNNILQKGSHEDVNVLHWETSKHWAGWGDNPSYGWAGYEVQVFMLLKSIIPILAQKDPCPVKCHFHGNQTDWHNADVVLFEPQPFGRR